MGSSYSSRVVEALSSEVPLGDTILLKNLGIDIARESSCSSSSSASPIYTSNHQLFPPQKLEDNDVILCYETKK